MKHTPGPWYVSQPNGTTDDNVSHSICVPFCRLADVQEVGRLGESEANAALIAAAPELLAACMAAQLALAEMARSAGDVTEWNEGGYAYEAAHKLRAAISLAEGGGQ